MPKPKPRRAWDREWANSDTTGTRKPNKWDAWEWANSDNSDTTTGARKNKWDGHTPAPKKLKTSVIPSYHADIVMPLMRGDDTLSSRFVRASGEACDEEEMQSYFRQCNKVLDDVRVPGQRKRLGVDLIGLTGLGAVPRIPSQVWDPDECKPTREVIAS